MEKQDEMTIDEVYEVLVNAGFIIHIVGMSFIVSLKNRNVRPMEVQIALDWPTNVQYAVSGDATVVTL